MQNSQGPAGGSPPKAVQGHSTSDREHCDTDQEDEKEGPVVVEVGLAEKEVVGDPARTEPRRRPGDQAERHQESGHDDQPQQALVKNPR